MSGERELLSVMNRLLAEAPIPDHWHTCTGCVVPWLHTDADCALRHEPISKMQCDECMGALREHGKQIDDVDDDWYFTTLAEYESFASFIRSANEDPQQLSRAQLTAYYALWCARRREGRWA